MVQIIEQQVATNILLADAKAEIKPIQMPK
jgi:hypothetical protein